MKHAQAAEASANALKDMAEQITALRGELAALNEKMDGVVITITEHMSSVEIFDALEAEAKRRNVAWGSSATPTNKTKGG